MAKNHEAAAPAALDLPSNLLPTTIGRNGGAVTTAYFLEAPRGVTPEQVAHPDFWVHLARRLKVHDRIEIVAADGSFDIELRVAALDPRGLWAQMRVLRLTRAAPAPIGPREDADGYKIEHDPVHQWRIIDRAGNLVDKGLADEPAAHAALARIKAEKRN